MKRYTVKDEWGQAILPLKDNGYYSLSGNIAEHCNVSYNFMTGEAVDRLAELEDEAERREKEQGDTNSGWISVEERLPNEDDDVIVLIREIEHYGRHGEKRKVYYWTYVGWVVDGEWATIYCHGHRYLDDENEKDPSCEHTVTHWMPLPEPPKEREE